MPVYCSALLIYAAAMLCLAKPVPDRALPCLAPAKLSFAQLRRSPAKLNYTSHSSAEAPPGFATPRNRPPCFSSPGYARAELSQTMPPLALRIMASPAPPKGSLSEGAVAEGD